MPNRQYCLLALPDYQTSAVFKPIRLCDSFKCSYGPFAWFASLHRLAYDGRGNYVVKTVDDLASGVKALGGYEHGLYAEKWAPFVKELAVMVVRSRDGTVVSYPVVETIHKNNICHVTEAPAGVPAQIQQRAKQVAEQAVGCLNGAGIFG